MGIGNCEKKINFYKYFEFEVEEEADKVLHLGHCSLWITNLDSKKNRIELLK